MKAVKESKTLSTYREVKIGKTIYRLTSRFEGRKNLDDTLKRLAVKRTAKIG